MPVFTNSQVSILKCQVFFRRCAEGFVLTPLLTTDTSGLLTGVIITHTQTEVIQHIFDFKKTMEIVLLFILHKTVLSYGLQCRSSLALPK